MSNEKLKPGKVFLNGIITENPTFRLVLGTCPTLAVTTMAINGLAMGLAVTFVLICSNMMISLLRKIIPDKIRIPAYITIIATFVTVIDMLMAAYLPDLYKTLGLFIPLIVVNCIILGRAESFASKNSVGLSMMDGLGMGLGFTLSLTTIGLIREFIGSGAIFGHPIPFLSNYSMIIFILPAGGFMTFGLLMALVNYVSSNIEEKKMNKKPILVPAVVAGGIVYDVKSPLKKAKVVEEVADALAKPAEAAAPRKKLTDEEIAALVAKKKAAMAAKAAAEAKATEQTQDAEVSAPKAEPNQESNDAPDSGESDK